MRLLIIFILFLTLNTAKAEVVSPTYVQTVASNVTMPSGIILSPDGTKIFMSSYDGDEKIYQFNLTTPFDISTLDTSSEVSLNLNDGSDDLMDTYIQGIVFNNDGTKIFAIDQTGLMNVHSLSTPYDISDFTQDADDGLEWDEDQTLYTDDDGDFEPHDITFNNDGTKMYLFDYNGDEVVVEYHLSTPFLPSSASLGNVLDLNDVNEKFLQDLRFDDDGTRMYLIDSGTGHGAWNFYVYKLSTGFDVSTATYVGKLANFFDASGGQGTPLGMHFSADGMKLYQVTYRGDSANKIHEYNLSCPYGIVICEADSISNVGAQVEFAKHVIQQNTSTVFKRFEWLRRNEGKNNLNNLTASIKLDNPLLNYWIKKLPTKIVSVNGAVENGRSITIGHENKNSNNLDNFTTVIKSDNPLLNSWMNKLPEKITAHRASLKKKSSKDKKTIKTKNKNWAYWSHGDISFGRKGDTATSKPKEIRVSGLMFGADKKINNNKFVGAAIRFGKGEIENISPGGIELDTESLTLNLYSTLPVNNNSNLNALFGVSLLRIDQLLSNEITGERNGKQVFTAFNLESKDSYGNFNIRPTGKFEFGVTQFSEYTDFGTSSTNSQDTYDSLTFKTGNIAAGFKFDNLIDINDGRLSRNGSLEYIRDLTSNIDYNFKNHLDSVSVTKTAETHSIHNIKGNLGFEILYESGYTFALNYERFQGLDYSSHQDSIFFKFGHIREEESEFAFNYKPLQNNQMELSYVKDVNGFDVKVISNYSLMNEIPDYGANIEVSGTF